MNRDLIKTITQSCENVPELDEQAFEGLAQEVDYRAREVIQEALKFASHAKRTRLLTEDVDKALRLRGVEQTYGYQAGAADVRLTKSHAFPGVTFVQDRVRKLDELVEDAKFPPLPLEKGIHLHWLAVRGVKPLIPENVRLKRAKVQAAEDKNAEDVGNGNEEMNGEQADGERKEEEGAVGDASTSSEQTNLLAYETNVSQQFKHIVTGELQSYFHKVTQAIMNHKKEGESTSVGSSSLGPIFSSLRCDPGLHPLVPYFSSFVVKQTSSKEAFTNLRFGQSLIDLIHALVLNPHVSWEKYLHQVIPIVTTFLVRKTIGRVGEDHWRVRRQAGRVLSAMCHKLEDEKSCYNLQSRIARTLVMKGMMDVTKALTSHYGSIVGVYCLGDKATENFLLPHLSTYMPCLGEALAPARSKGNPLQQYEAYQCLEALLTAVGELVHKSEYNALLKERHIPAYQPKKAKGSKMKIPEGSLGPSSSAFVGGGDYGKRTSCKRGARRTRKVSQKVTAEELKKTAAGRSVLEAFDCQEVFSSSSSSEVQEFGFGGSDSVQSQNNFKGMPLIEGTNIVSHTFHIFGEHILPFLSCDYISLTL